MAGHQQGHELIAQLLGAHRRAVLVPGLEQHRQDVVAVAALRTALGDLLGDQLVDPRAHVDESLERTGAVEQPQLALGALGIGGSGHERQRALAVAEEPRDLLAQGVEARPRIEPEHRAEDDFECERPQTGLQGDLAASPAPHLVPGHALHQPAQALHPLAVEGREQQPALLHVRIAVEQDQGVRAHQRLEHPGALAGVQDVGRSGEDLLDLIRLGEDDERRRERKADREALAVALTAALGEGERPRPQSDPLDEGRSPRTVRKPLLQALSS